jgi:hypothetical protein
MGRAENGALVRFRRRGGGTKVKDGDAGRGKKKIPCLDEGAQRRGCDRRSAAARHGEQPESCSRFGQSRKVSGVAVEADMAVRAIASASCPRIDLISPTHGTPSRLLLVRSPLIALLAVRTSDAGRPLHGVTGCVEQNFRCRTLWERFPRDKSQPTVQIIRRQVQERMAVAGAIPVDTSPQIKWGLPQIIPMYRPAPRVITPDLPGAARSSRNISLTACVAMSLGLSYVHVAG